MVLGPLRFTNAVGGTADFIYPGPIIDMQSPASAAAVDGATYLIYAQSFDMSQWEIATGAYTASSGTFARTTVKTNSLATTAKINFGTPPQVFIIDNGTSAVSTKVVSAGAQADFDFAGGFPAGFIDYELHIINATPSVNDASMALRVKTTGSLTVQTSGYSYAGRVQGQGGGADFSATLDGLSDRINLHRPGAGNGLLNSLGGLSGILRFRNPNAVGSTYTGFDFAGSFLRSDTIFLGSLSTGFFGSATPITGLRLLMSSGNISGTFILRGIG